MYWKVLNNNNSVPTTEDVQNAVSHIAEVTVDNDLGLPSVNFDPKQREEVLDALLDAGMIGY